jgi:hypothetical protein
MSWFIRVPASDTTSAAPAGEPAQA